VFVKSNNGQLSPCFGRLRKEETGFKHLRLNERDCSVFLEVVAVGDNEGETTNPMP
jgi:hypothetical protein